MIYTFINTLISFMRILLWISKNLYIHRVTIQRRIINSGVSTRRLGVWNPDFLKHGPRDLSKNVIKIVKRALPHIWDFLMGVVQNPFFGAVPQTHPSTRILDTSLFQNLSFTRHSVWGRQTDFEKSNRGNSRNSLYSLLFLKVLHFDELQWWSQEVRMGIM